MAKQPLISIVDDNGAVREAIARQLKSCGYVTQTFESAAALLGSDARTLTDCLIVDMQMPGMTGLELYARLAAAGEQIPTILITAHPDENLRASALRAGVLGYLAKPCNAEDLLGCVRRALGR